VCLPRRDASSRTPPRNDPDELQQEKETRKGEMKEIEKRRVGGKEKEEKIRE
jgi:hypothetical protein